MEKHVDDVARPHDRDPASGKIGAAFEAAFGRLVAPAAWYMFHYPAEAPYYWAAVEYKRRVLPGYLEFFEERAATIEHKAGHTREEAETLACLAVLNRITHEHHLNLLDLYATVRACLS